MLELLAPAGDMECLKSAVLFGADAVYIGTNAFGMRASPKNFTLEELFEAVSFAHQHNVKVYLTCNTVPTNDEADGFPQFIADVEKTGIDAVIVADFGVLAAVKKYAPSLDIHMSTQVGVVNYAAVNALEELGASRVVLAREVSLEEIKKLKSKISPKMELEVFVHGAMCVSFSGRCLLSSYLVNRDANRGECAQPCRWGYYLTEEKRPDLHFEITEDENSSYILNAKDLCMIEHLKDLRDAGVTSLKIEGRAKSAYYVAVVVNAYRNAIDKLLSDESIEDWIKDEVNNVSHRPYSTGFFYGHPNDCQYYKSSGYVRDRDFIGVVNGYDGKYIEIVQRNYFTVNDDIEILAPGEKPVKLVFKSMKNSKMEDVEIANHANETIYFESENGFPKHSILRKRL